jgi:hypothetical protein
MSDADPPDFWAPPELRRARKSHRCCECCGTIALGEQHWRFAGVWVGDFMTFRACVPCEELRQEIVDDCGEEYRPPFEGLRDAYDEHYPESGGMELRR